MITPSREFMVQQAVLNAAAILYPLSTKLYGLGRTLRAQGYTEICGDGQVWPNKSKLFCAAREEFRKIANAYKYNCEHARPLFHGGRELG